MFKIKDTITFSVLILISVIFTTVQFGSVDVQANSNELKTATSVKSYDLNRGNISFTASKRVKNRALAAQKAREAQKQKDERAKQAIKQVSMRAPWDNGNVYDSVQELDESGVNESIRQMSRDVVDKKLVYININRQQFTALEDGQIVKQGNIATGKTKFPTIQGEFQIWDKKYKKILRAPTPEYGKYELPVDYWMPFHKGFGLHDAWWRSTFGGQNYLFNGSHGCINMQYSDSQWLFEWSNIGTTVFVSK